MASKVYRQLDFLAVGSWWIYDEEEKTTNPKRPIPSARSTWLLRIPGNREDVFADKTIDPKSKRSLMNFLRPAADSTGQASTLAEWGDKTFEDFLISKYGIPRHLQVALHALTLSPDPPSKTLTSYAIPRIHRHLTSIGVFGPGFGSVIPKWGGTAEIAQVACRAGAVGGGVYVLNKAIEECSETTHTDANISNEDNSASRKKLIVKLQDEQTIQTSWIAGCDFDLPSIQRDLCIDDGRYSSRMISIISSPLSRLFPVITEGAPLPAGAVVVFPGKSSDDHPAYMIIHSSETGECPEGQSMSRLFSLSYHFFMMTQIKRILIYIVCNSIEDKTPLTV